MSSRRAFFKQLALSVAAIRSANILIPAAADAFKWKRPAGRYVYVPNEEYINAPYEIAVLKGEYAFDLQTYSRAMGPLSCMIPTSYPIRMATPTGKPVPPFKLVYTSEPMYDCLLYTSPSPRDS